MIVYYIEWYENFEFWDFGDKCVSEVFKIIITIKNNYNYECQKNQNNKLTLILSFETKYLQILSLFF